AGRALPCRYIRFFPQFWARYQILQSLLVQSHIAFQWQIAASQIRLLLYLSAWFSMECSRQLTNFGQMLLSQVVDSDFQLCTDLIGKIFQNAAILSKRYGLEA